jgi:hypothetical protein
MNRAIPFALIAIVGAVAGTLIAVAPAWAEGSKVVQHTSLPIFGSVAETDSTEWVSPQAKRSEATSRIQGGLIGTLAKMHRGNRERITITRLDKGVVWTLDPSSRTYTEVPIARYQDAAAEGRGRRRLQRQGDRGAEDDRRLRLPAVDHGRLHRARGHRVQGPLALGVPRRTMGDSRDGGDTALP